jgi:hypothetical protein
LQPLEPQRFIWPSPVAGILYVDSAAPKFFIDNQELEELVLITWQFLTGVINTFHRNRLRMQNIPLSGLGTDVPEVQGLPDETYEALELADLVDSPMTNVPFQLNIDHLDFVPDR